jgi:hypothetical protein
MLKRVGGLPPSRYRMNLAAIHGQQSPAHDDAMLSASADKRRPHNELASTVTFVFDINYQASERACRLAGTTLHMCSSAWGIVACHKSK